MQQVLSLVVGATLATPLDAQDTARRTIEFSGQALVNGFYNTNRTNNSDVPLFVVTPPGIVVRGTFVRPSGGGGTIRQTRLGVVLTEPVVLGGTFTGDLDVDFFGGQLGNGGRTFPLLRVRRLVGRINWSRGELLFGQESPLIADINPRSLASVGIPGFATAGNLWFWMPQVRGTYEIGSRVRLAVQGAILAPMTGSPQRTFDTELDLAEQSGRPFLQGRLRLGWGPSDDPSELAIGGHQGWFAETDSTLTTSRAVAVNWQIKVGIGEIRGEWYSGHGLAALGGGGIGRNFDQNLQPLNDQGGWAQLNLRPIQRWEFGGGCGIDEPNQAQLDVANDFERLKNFVCEGHVMWRPSGPLVVGFEFRQLKTRYGGTTGELTNNHLNVQTGFRF